MKKDCIVIGSGGQARALCSILLDVNEPRPVGVVDLNYVGQDESILGIKVIGISDTLENFLVKKGVENIFLALGDNLSRQNIFNELKKKNFIFPNLISKRALLKQNVILGEGNVIFDNAYIGPLSKIGDNNIINTACTIEHECQIGNHCNIGPGVVIAGRSTLNENIFMGASATVIDKVTLCDHVTLGAGTVVTKNIDEQGIYVGVPAKKLKD